MRGNLLKVLFISLLLVAVPVIGLVLTDATSVLAGSRPARTTKRLIAQVERAKVEVREGSPDRKIDRAAYLDRLRAIDPSATPSFVQKAFSNYVTVLERSLGEAAGGRNTNSTVVEWEREEKAFRDATERVIKRRR